MRRFALAAAMLMALAGPVSAQPGPVPVIDEPVIAPVTTAHTARIGGGDIAYDATFAETVLKDAKGVPQATISATAYVRRDVADKAARPVVFLFNGGPGASSSPLQFEALGPRRRTEAHDAQGRQVFVDNADSLLDAADLIFIDPVGTGFSRVLPGGAGQAYWTTQGDADCVRGLIEAWLKDNHRTGSPVYLVGESYGGFRLADLVKDAGDMNIAGLVLVSPLLDASAASEAPGNDLPYIFALPSMAVAAWEHHKAGRADATAAQVFDAAARFAQSDYALALLRGSALAPDQRDRIAARMAVLIGLPADQIADARLRISNQVFLDSLMAAEGEVVGRTDTRVTAPKPTTRRDPKRAPAADDPALGMKGGNVIRSPGIRAYMTDELKVPGQRPYVSLSLDVNAQFRLPARELDEAFYVNPTPNITAELLRQPKARVLLVGGYFDMAVPILAPRYALSHAGVPPDRVEILALPAGHSPFGEDSTRDRFSEALHRFVDGPR